MTVTNLSSCSWAGNQVDNIVAIGDAPVGFAQDRFADRGLNGLILHQLDTHEQTAPICRLLMEKFFS